MYNIIYIDATGVETRLAEDLVDRDGACEYARREAAERGAGRAMLPGSTNLRDCVCVVPSASLTSAA
jgi:hypothetical protein